MFDFDQELESMLSGEEYLKSIQDAREKSMADLSLSPGDQDLFSAMADIMEMTVRHRVHLTRSTMEMKTHWESLSSISAMAISSELVPMIGTFLGMEKKPTPDGEEEVSAITMYLANAFCFGVDWVLNHFLDEAEWSAIVAGLRLLQEEMENPRRGLEHLEVIMSGMGKHDPLTIREIDLLVDKINVEDRDD
jgi:hypothetical protein